MSDEHLAIAAVLAQPPTNTSWDTLNLGPVYKPNSHGRRCHLLPETYVTARAAQLRDLVVSADSAATELVSAMFERSVADPRGPPPARARAMTFYGKPMAGYEDFADRADEQMRLWRAFEQDFFSRYTRHFGIRGPLPYRESGFQGELEVLIAASGPSIVDETSAVIDRYLPFLGFAVLAVMLVLMLQLRSLKLALCAAAQILGSLPLGIFVFQQLLGITKMTELALLSGILTVGIGADDVIVYTGAWRLARERGSPTARLRETLSAVGFSLVNTSFTSALGFLSLAFSPVPGLGSFGVLSAVFILSDLVLTLTLWPACVLLTERRCALADERHARACATEASSGVQAADSRGHAAWRATRGIDGVVPHACRAFARGLAWSEGHRLLKPVSVALLTTSVCTVGVFAAAASTVQLKDHFSGSRFRAPHTLARVGELYDEFGGHTNMHGAVVFGLNTLDRRGVDMFELTAERGVVQWDEELRLEEPATQQAFLTLARRLREARCAVAACSSHPALLKPGAPVDFFLEAWADELNRTQGRGLPHGDAFEPQLRAWLATPRGAPHLHSAGMVHGRLRFVQLHFTSTTLDVSEYVRTSHLNELQERWRAELEEAAEREAMPVLARGFAIFPRSHGCNECDPRRVISLLALYQLAPTLLQAVYFSLAVCTVACLLVVAFTARSLRLGLFSALSVISILAVLLGCLRPLGWQLGVSEMGGVMLCVGFCVDYTLHLACTYHHSTAPTREARMAEAAERMGPSVLGGALTTVCAVVFLLFGDLEAIFKLAVLLLLTIGTSLASAFGLFLPLCALAGPEYARPASMEGRPRVQKDTCSTVPDVEMVASRGTTV